MTRLDWLLLWVLAVGVWPFADPGHSGATPLSVLDVLLHALAGALLLARALERRVAS